MLFLHGRGGLCFPWFLLRKTPLRSSAAVVSTMAENKDRFSLKDRLFNPEKVDLLSSQLVAAYPNFPKQSFDKKVLQGFPSLELKQRIAHISHCLHEALEGPDFATAVDIMVRALPPPCDPNLSDDDFGDFIYAPFSHYVAEHGCNTECMSQSLTALHAMTQRFSVEFAIRTFLNTFPKETLDFLTNTCAQDPHYHVRRLASEGTRPKLPWAAKLTAIDYKDPLPILDSLRNDPTRYVTRSVANHLHDISKIDANLVLSILERWKREDDSEEMEFIRKHALRTLVKQKHKEALLLLGFSSPRVTITEFTTSTPTVTLGEALEFAVKMRALANQSLVVDYSIEFPTKGKKCSTKVFKLKSFNVTKDQALTLTKRHPLRQMTTRQLFPGIHTVTIQVNGEAFDSFQFALQIARK